MTVHRTIGEVRRGNSRPAEGAALYHVTMYAEGGGSAAVTEHRLMPAEKIRHPGGKDGWYRAACACGKSATEAYPGRAERRINDHIRDKEGE